MDEIIQAIQIDFSYIFISVITILVGIKSALSLVEWFFNKLGLETKSMRRKREDHKLLIDTTKSLKNLYQDKEQELKKIHEDNVVWREHSIEVQKKYDERFKKLDRVKEQTEQFVENEKNKKQQIDSLTLALKELLAAKINEKYKYYISIKGIPEDEVDEFTSLHFAYKGCGGNHHGDAKYNYVIKNLPVIPVETKLIYDNDTR